MRWGRGAATKAKERAQHNHCKTAEADADGRDVNSLLPQRTQLRLTAERVGQKKMKHIVTSMCVLQPGPKLEQDLALH